MNLVEAGIGTTGEETIELIKFNCGIMKASKVPLP